VAGGFHLLLSAKYLLVEPVSNGSIFRLKECSILTGQGECVGQYSIRILSSQGKH
jgi:hypothetical protein